MLLSTHMAERTLVPRVNLTSYLSRVKVAEINIGEHLVFEGYIWYCTCAFFISNLQFLHNPINCFNINSK